MIAAYQLAQVTTFSHMFTDGTRHITIEMENQIIGFMSENVNGFKCITLSSSICAESKSAKGSTEAILDTFKEGMEVLILWHNKTKAMYPGQPELVDMIPKPSELDIGKIHDGSITTDMCNKLISNVITFFLPPSKRLL